MIGYKASYNQICKNQKYEPGETYTIDGSLIMCVNGFHFCQNPDDVLGYYEPNKNLVIFEVEPLGKIIIDKNKSVTDKIKIIRIVPKEEWNDIFTDYEFDENGNMIHFKDLAVGFEEWKEYDKNNNCTHYKDSYGEEFWKEYDEYNNKIYYKDSHGYEHFFN